MDLLAHAAVNLLEILFFVGIVGSSGVVLLSFVEDAHELFDKDEHPESTS